MESNTALARSLTQDEIETTIPLFAEEMYKHEHEHHKIRNTLSLFDASSFEGDTYTAFTADDALPTTPIQAIDTGLLPPADPAAIVRQRLDNKNATSLHKARKLMDMDSLTLADTEGYRIRTAYRLVRQMARIRGLLHGWDRLYSAMSSDPYNNGLNLWNVPIKIASSGSLVGFRGVRGVLYEVERAKERYTINTVNGYHAYKGATTLPPPIPDQLYSQKSPEDIWRARLERVVPEGYSASKDLPLCLYCEAMELLTHQMSIRRGAPEEPWSGEYGIAGLLNPTTARLAWPSADELTLYEEELLLHVFDYLSESSEIQTQRYLEKYFGFTRFECVDIVKTATGVGGILYAEEAEEQRAVILKRLDSIADKSADACDIRAELAAVSKKSQILGLTSVVVDENMQTLRDAAVATLRNPEDDDDI